MNDHPPPVPAGSLHATQMIHDPGSALGLPRELAAHRSVALQDGWMLMHWQSRAPQAVHVDLLDDSGLVHFNYVLRGKGRARLEGTEPAADEGAAERPILAHTGNIAYGPGRRWHLRQQGDYESVSVMLRADLLEQWLGQAGSNLSQRLRSGPCFETGCRGGDLHRCACSLAQRLTLEARPGDAETVARSLWLRGVSLTMVSLLLEASSEPPAATPHSALDGHARTRLALARERLLVDLSQPPRLTDLARGCGLSQPRLQQGFRQLYGCSVYGLFQRERMQAAQRLLQAGEGSVSRVAAELGYTNISHFTAAFRKALGFNPGELCRHRRRRPNA